MRQRKNKYQRKILQMKLGLMLVGVMILVMSGLAVAKYYSLHVQKGVGVASDFYFESDVLQEVSDADIDSTDFQNFGTYVAAGWGTKGSRTVVVSIDIKSYLDKLRYNKDIDITYDLYVQLAEEDTRQITYQITSSTANDSAKTISTIKTKIFENAVLKGAEKVLQSDGTYSYQLDSDNSKHTYKITVSAAASVEENALPKEIYIWAVPSSPNYIKKSLAAKIKIAMGSAGFQLTGGFDMPNLTSSNYKDMIEKYSAFPYRLETSGIPEDGLNENGKIPIQLRWNSNYLKINQFDVYYMQEKNNVTTDENGITTMQIEISPDSIAEIVFFRKNQNGFLTNIDTYEKFHSLIEYERIITNAQSE